MRKFWILLLCAVLLAGCSPATPSSTNSDTPPVSLPPGYTAVSPYVGGFIAVGFNGRIDFFSVSDEPVLRSSGVTDHLLAVAASPDAAPVVAVGSNGIILYSDDGEAFSQVSSPASVDLTAAAYNPADGSFFAGGAGGVLLYSKDGMEWTRLDNQNLSDITGLTCGNGVVIAVTKEGTILVVADGKTTSAIHNIKSASFHSVIFTDGLFMAGGTINDDFPLVATSTLGQVWSTRVLDMLEQEPADFSGFIPSAMSWDGVQAYAAGQDGRVLILPDCHQCNVMLDVADFPVRAASFNTGHLLIAGDGFLYEWVETDIYKQHRISAETALEKQGAGALIIDVRDEAEYTASHIKDCIWIPLNELEEKLPVLAPSISTELIFYCSKGVRAMTAVERATAMGYLRLYNLGGIGDWPFETEGMDTP